MGDDESDDDDGGDESVPGRYLEIPESSTYVPSLQINGEGMTVHLSKS